MAIDLDLEPRLLAPRRRQLVRLVLGRREVRAVRARATADRVELVEPFENAHAVSLVAARAAADAFSRPAEREHGAASRNAQRRARQRGARAAANTTGDDGCAERRDSTDCWKPIAAPLRAAAELGSRRERERVPSHRQAARDSDRGHQDPQRPAPPAAATTARHDRDDRCRPAEAADRESRRRPTTDPPIRIPTASTCDAAITSAATRSKSPCSSWRKTTPKPMIAICA